MALTDNLFAYWSLDEASGTRSDSHGSTHLTDNNTVTSNTGKVGTAAEFVAGNTEYLSASDSADLSFGDIGFTVSAWVYIGSKAAVRPVIGKYNTPSNIEWLVRYNSSGDRLEFQASGNGSTVTTLVANTFGSPALNTWYHVVAWHDAAGDTLNISVNDGTPDSTAHSAGIFDSATPFEIGGAQSSGAQNIIRYTGRIDEVGIWKRVLTSGERTFLYNGGAGRAYADLSAGSGYTLTADAGSLALTGQAAALRYSRRLPADPGSYTIAGSPAAFLRHLRLSASPGSVTVTGADAGLSVSGGDRSLSADPGSVAITGSPATLRYGRKLAASPASFTVTGGNATLRASRRLALAAGSVSLTGQAATLTYSGLSLPETVRFASPTLTGPRFASPTLRGPAFASPTLSE